MEQKCAITVIILVYSLTFSNIWNIHGALTKLIVTVKIEIEDNSYKMEMVNKSYTNGILPR